jgi:hypothetical protein
MHVVIFRCHPENRDAGDSVLVVLCGELNHGEGFPNRIERTRQDSNLLPRDDATCFFVSQFGNQSARGRILKSVILPLQHITKFSAMRNIEITNTIGRGIQVCYPLKILDKIQKYAVRVRSARKGEQLHPK